MQRETTRPLLLGDSQSRRKCVCVPSPSLAQWLAVACRQGCHSSRPTSCHSEGRHPGEASVSSWASAPPWAPPHPALSLLDSRQPLRWTPPCSGPPSVLRTKFFEKGRDGEGAGGRPEPPPEVLTPGCVTQQGSGERHEETDPPEGNSCCFCERGPMTKPLAPPYNILGQSPHSPRPPSRTQ